MSETSSLSNGDTSNVIKSKSVKSRVDNGIKHSFDLSPPKAVEKEFRDKSSCLLNPPTDPCAGERANKSSLDILRERAKREFAATSPSNMHYKTVKSIAQPFHMANNYLRDTGEKSKQHYLFLKEEQGYHQTDLESFERHLTGNSIDNGAVSRMLDEIN